MDLSFDLPTIPPHILQALKLIKMLHTNINVERSLTNFQIIKDYEFLNPNFEQLLHKDINDPHTILTGNFNKTLKAISVQAPFMLSEAIRILCLKVTTLDKNRALYFMMQYLKSQGAGLNAQDSKIGSIRRCKIRVKRDNILDCGIKVMEVHGNSHSLIEFDFSDEKGSGLGPTMEFYSLSADTLKNMASLWRKMENGSLFPAPIESVVIKEKVLSYFKFIGWLCARSICDDRLVDLPFSDLFWDLVLQKPITLFDILKLDSKIGSFCLELEALQKKKEEIEKNPQPDIKERISSLRYAVILYY